MTHTGWWCGGAILGMAFAVAGHSVHAQGAASPDLRTQLEQTMNRAEAAEAQRDALTGQAVALRRQLEQIQSQMVPACVDAIEKGNPGKTVNPAHQFAIEEKAVPLDKK